jgi:hypothetical protein
LCCVIPPVVEGCFGLVRKTFHFLEQYRRWLILPVPLAMWRRAVSPSGGTGCCGESSQTGCSGSWNTIDGDGGHDSDGSGPRCLSLLVGRWAGFGVVDDDASV